MNLGQQSRACKFSRIKAAKNLVEFHKRVGNLMITILFLQFDSNFYSSDTLMSLEYLGLIGEMCPVRFEARPQTLSLHSLELSCLSVMCRPVLTIIIMLKRDLGISQLIPVL